jgi:hypothetical protein
MATMCRFFYCTDDFLSKQILNTLNLDTSIDLNVEVNVDELTRKIKIRATGIWWLIFQALTTGILLGLLLMVTLKR